MEDEKIVALYWERSEAAIAETQRKYGSYCYSIAYRILYSEQDAEECENDTYLRAWESIPPHQPMRLATFLGKITRNIALNRYHYEHAQKRFFSATVVFDEIAELIPDPSESSDPCEENLLRDAINRFLKSLTREARIIFVRRYWYFSTIEEISRDYGWTQSKIKVSLHRSRIRMKHFLEKERIVL